MLKSDHPEISSPAVAPHGKILGQEAVLEQVVNGGERLRALKLKLDVEC
jgi:hypothetical protein